MADINQTVEFPTSEEDCIECDIIIEDGAFDGFEGKTINITENSGSQGDVQAGIEFIYHMREHIVDVTVATAYLLVVYAIYMWIKKKLS
jgi:molybdopterin/thiamine biosynthesis adenylyltransferase